MHVHILWTGQLVCGPALVERVARRWPDVTLCTLKHS